MQRLTKIGVAVGSVGIAIILGLLAIIESNPFNCPFNEFMCSEPPEAQLLPAIQPSQIAHADNKLDASAIPPPELPDATINALKQIAFGLPEVKQWSADGWQFATIAYIGVDSPSLKWNYAVVYLVLPPTVKAPAYCENGWEADVKIDLDTMKPVEFYAPSASDHVCAQDWFRPP